MTKLQLLQFNQLSKYHLNFTPFHKNSKFLPKFTMMIKFHNVYQIKMLPNQLWNAKQCNEDNANYEYNADNTRETEFTFYSDTFYRSIDS